MTESIEEKKQDDPSVEAPESAHEAAAEQTEKATSEQEKPVLVIDYEKPKVSADESVLSKFMAERKGPLVEVVEDRRRKPRTADDPGAPDDRGSSACSSQSADEETATVATVTGEALESEAPSVPADSAEDDHVSSPSDDQEAEGTETGDEDSPRLEVSHVVAPEMIASSPGYLKRQKEREELRKQREREAREEASAKGDDETEAPTGIVEEVSSFTDLETDAATEPSDSDGPSEAPSEPVAETADDSVEESSAGTDTDTGASADVPPLEFVEPDDLPEGAGVDKDSGELNLEAKLRGYTKTVRAAQLAARHKKVQVMGMSMVKTLIEDSVNETIQNLDRNWDEEQRQRLLEEAEESFNERLQAFQAEKAGLEEQTQHLQDQLVRAEDLLEEERQKVIRAEQFTVSDAGLMELEQRLSRLLDRAVSKGKVDSDIEDEMRGVMARLLDDEREKIREKAQDAQNDSILLLERKVGRLANSLDEAEKDRDVAQRRAHALEMAGGVAFKNVCDVGIGEEDPQKDRKLKLMKALVEGNREVRQFMGDNDPAANEKSEDSKNQIQTEQNEKEGPSAAPAEGEE